MWSVGALAGVMFGQERLSSNSVTTDFGRRAKVYGIFMPVGIDYSYSKNARQDTYGIFVSLLDLGAIATLRSGDNSDTVSVESEANFGFEQIVSPGIYFRYGIPNSPLVIGAGWSRTPRLRSITIKSTAESIDMDSTRLLLFMAVDVPLFPIN